MAGREGQKIGDYQLIGLLGEGLFTSVYLGEHIHQKTKVAVKVLEACDDEVGFLEEAQFLTHLIHPHLIRIRECGIEAGLIPYLIMDYMPSGNFRQHYPKGVPLPLSIIINYVNQISLALQYLHNQKHIHRGIKPESILIGQNNNVLLGDPLVARDWYWDTISLSSPSVEEIMYYTAYYTAPEYSIKGRSYPASDQYALGVVVYEWLSGKLPFNGFSPIELAIQHLQASPPALYEIDPKIPPSVEDVVMKALAKDPEQRFESVQAFANALEEAYLSSIGPKTLDRVGQKFGNYRLVRLLGRGGFADVYLGQHQRLNTHAAIKVLHTHLSNDDLESFQKEAQTIANLKHPYIVRVLDFDVEDGIPFLVMDHAPNGTLRQRHPKRSRLPITTVVSYVKQVANALQFAHDQKLIHRDIKPENMLLGPNNEVLLSDFGIAVVAHSSKSMNIQNDAGTVYYMAPEQIQGKPRRATDQYALAVVVYEWLTGHRPFNGTYMEIVTQHLTTPPPSLRDKNPEIPPAVEQVVMIALAKDPHQRFASVQAFTNALEQASQRQP